MYINCVGQVIPVPDAVRELEALQLWLKDGTVLRFAVVRGKENRVVTVFSTAEKAAEGAVRGSYVVPLRRMERDAQDLMQMINSAIDNSEAIRV